MDPLRQMFRTAACSAALSALFASAPGVATAQDLVYEPVNPTFGGPSLNSSHLLNIANAQREATARDAGDDGGGRSTDITDSPGRDNADLFVRQLEGRLLSALSRQVTDAIFGENPQDSGTVTFGSTTVSFDRSLEEISLVITDNLEGTVTEIVVPQLVVTE